LRLATLTAACLLAEAVIAKNLLEVRLDPFSQIALFWAYLVAVISGRDLATDRACTEASPLRGSASFAVEDRHLLVVVTLAGGRPGR
jgi:hypothetical protein